MILQTPRPDEFIPLMGMVTGIVSMIAIAFAVVGVAKSQIGNAIARRIQGKGVQDAELREELYELREQVAALEQRVAESDERLDFAERLLARPPEAQALLPGGEPRS